MVRKLDVSHKKEGTSRVVIHIQVCACTHGADGDFHPPRGSVIVVAIKIMMMHFHWKCLIIILILEIFQFTSWRDRGVPVEPAHLVQLVQVSRVVNHPHDQDPGEIRHP